MPSKEECREALSKARIMLEEYMWKNNLTWKQQLEFRDAIITLEDLYLEHFDNPPLKFEELKEGMWVWDNEKNKYNKIVSIEKDKNIEFYYIANDRTKFKVKYKENRFYRKQVDEE